jgi:hypothetical protein
VVDRLIADYGCEYFKIDYNVTTGPGSDLNADSMGDAMLMHYRALYDWIRSIYAKHPYLVIENCGSGASAWTTVSWRCTAYSPPLTRRTTSPTRTLPPT